MVVSLSCGVLCSVFFPPSRARPARGAGWLVGVGLFAAGGERGALCGVVDAGGFGFLAG